MTVLAALLRNVNVGTCRITMPELRRVFADAGCEDVTSHLQSGNVVFRSSRPPDELTADLEARVAAAAGFAAPVLLRTGAELEQVVRACPWAGEDLDPTRLVVVFGRVAVPATAVERLRAHAVDGEEVVAAGRELHLRLPHGQGRSRLAAAVGRADLGGPATARNWRTVTKLLELVAAR